jgi:hypothetical protein
VCGSFWRVDKIQNGVAMETKFDKRNPIFSNPPFFVSMATAAKFVQPIPIFFFFLANLVPLDKMESVGQTLPQLPWK